MEKFQHYIQHNRAAIFDWSVITISFLLGFIFPTLKDFIVSGDFKNWMFAALLLYTAGAAMKHLPLSYRLQFTTPRPVPYFIFLMVGHWFVLLVVIIFSEQPFRYLTGLPPLAGKDEASWPLILTYACLSAFVTWLVYRDKTKRKSRKKWSASFLFRQELLADLFMIGGASIISFVFWEKGVMGMLSRSNTQTIGDIWFLFVFLSILFVFVYLPLRYLYFIEDREGGRNRRRLLLIFGFVLLRALLEMLNL